ncbi:unnamed protein product [Bathycoccus prasinos]
MSALSLASNAFTHVKPNVSRRGRLNRARCAASVVRLESHGVASVRNDSFSANTHFVRKSSGAGGALSAQILPAKASTFTSSSSAFYQHCSKRNNNNNTSAMRSCLQVFNAVSNYAGAEDQGTGRVDKSQFHAAMRIPNTAMAKIGRQLGGGGAATLEKVSMDLSSSVQSVAAPKLSDGDNGGNNGGKINNGGAAATATKATTTIDGDGDEGGYISLREGIPETFEREAIQAVLSEWFKTIASLPAGLRMAVEMGVVSSAQLVRFMSVDVRPSVVRVVSRSTPQWASRAFVGRLMAEPAFLYKLAFEQAVTVAAGTMYEVAHRGDKLKKEWDLAASNVAQMCVANLATVWLCTPSRSFGGVQKFGWQKALAGMPNNAFDRAGPLRPYTTGTRIASVVAKGAELSAVGVVIGGAFSGLNNLLVNSHKKKEGKKWKPAVPVPDVKTSTLGMGAFLGLSCNARYQLIGGADRWMTDRLTSLGSAITATALMRLTNNQVGEQTRLFLLGLPLHAQRQRVRGTTGYTRASSKKSAGGVRKTKKVKRKVKRKVPATAVAADATVAPPATPAMA